MAIANLRPIAFVIAATNHGSMLVNRYDYRLVEGGGYGVRISIAEQLCFRSG